MTETHPDCAEVRAELVTLLYADAEPAAADRLRRHLAGCDACRAELAALEGTRSALDLWTPASPLGEPADIVRALRPPRSARPVLLAVAAGLLAFLALGAFGARVEVAEGRMTVSLALPWVPPAPASRGGLDGAEWEQRMRSIARQEADARSAVLTDSQTERLADWSRREEQQRLQLVRSIDDVRLRDRRALQGALFDLRQGAQQETRITREALLELASLVADRDESR